MMRIARINLYPIKSLDALTVDQARILPSSALEHDRRYALYNAQHVWINGKATPAIHPLRAQFAADASAVELRSERDGRQGSFRLPDEVPALNHWLTAYFGEPVTINDNARSGFPDDTDSPGPTIISQQTLAEVAGWFGLSTDEVRRRFRANIELDGDAPFCEYRLFAEPGQVVRFTLGEVTLEGVNPCARCIVPTRDSRTGDTIVRFAKDFALRRQQTLPAWVNKARFDHFYRLSVNTRLAPVNSGGIIRVGDEVRVLETVRA